MSRSRILFALFLALCCLPSVSFAQLGGKINLGWSFPTGPTYLKDYKNADFSFGIGVEYMLHPLTSVGIDVSRSPWKLGDSYKYTWIPILLYVRQRLTVGTTFYFRAGMGLYHTDSHFEYQSYQYDYDNQRYSWVTFRGSQKEDDFGIHVGFGGEYYTGGTIVPYLETKFNYVYPDVGKRIHFMDVTAGIIVHFTYWY